MDWRYFKQDYSILYGFLVNALLTMSERVAVSDNIRTIAERTAEINEREKRQTYRVVRGEHVHLVEFGAH